MSQPVAQPVVNKSEIINYFNQWKHFRSSFEGFQLIMESQFNALDRLHDEYMRQHEEYEQYRKTSDETNRRLKSELNDIESKYTAIKEELANLKKVSIYTHLSKEMDDLRNYNAILEKQVKQLRATQNAKPVVVELAPPAPSVKDVEEDTKVEEEDEEVYDPQKDRVEDSDVEAEGDRDVEAEGDSDVEDDEVAEEEDAEEEGESEEKDEVAEEDGVEEEGESEEKDEVAEEDAEEEPEIEYESRKIGKKYYYVSNEEPVGIYLVIKESGEVGDKVGEYDENDKPVFYK